MKSANWSKDLTVLEVIVTGDSTTLKMTHPLTGATILLDKKIKFEGSGSVPEVEVGSKITVRFENQNACGWRKTSNGKVK